MLDFEWGESKAATNLKKHGISFDEAASVFADPMAYSVSDPDHSEDESRYLTFGKSQTGRVLVVIHTHRAHAIRIISARKATRHERGIYEQS